MKKTNYSLFITEDLSPTLIYRPHSAIETTHEPSMVEPMHNLKGAFSESLYVYEPGLSLCQESGGSKRFLSIGLGLGYIELLIICHFLKFEHTKSTPYYIHSYESDPFLIKQFFTALNANKNIGQLSPPYSSDDRPQDISLEQVYQMIFYLYQEHFKVSVSQICQTLLNFYEEKFWILHPALTEKSIFKTRFSAIFFDAYSEKMNQHLWSEQFLNQFLRQVSEEHCVFSTYAAKGNLNRALRLNSFIRQPRTGFKGKRQSTLALKTKNEI